MMVMEHPLTYLEKSLTGNVLQAVSGRIHFSLSSQCRRDTYSAFIYTLLLVHVVC